MTNPDIRRDLCCSRRLFSYSIIHIGRDQEKHLPQEAWMGIIT